MCVCVWMGRSSGGGWECGGGWLGGQEGEWGKGLEEGGGGERYIWRTRGLDGIKGRKMGFSRGVNVRRPLLAMLHVQWGFSVDRQMCDCVCACVCTCTHCVCVCVSVGIEFCTKGSRRGGGRGADEGAAKGRIVRSRVILQ